MFKFFDISQIRARVQNISHKRIYVTVLLYCHYEWHCQTIAEEVNKVIFYFGHETNTCLQ